MKKPVEIVFVLKKDYDYMTAGVPYFARVGKRTVAVERQDRSSGTFVARWQWEKMQEMFA